MKVKELIEIISQSTGLTVLSIAILLVLIVVLIAYKKKKTAHTVGEDKLEMKPAAQADAGATLAAISIAVNEYRKNN